MKHLKRLFIGSLVAGGIALFAWLIKFAVIWLDTWPWTPVVFRAAILLIAMYCFGYVAVTAVEVKAHNRKARANETGR